MDNIFALRFYLNIDISIFFQQFANNCLGSNSIHFIHFNTVPYNADKKTFTHISKLVMIK